MGGASKQLCGAELPDEVKPQQLYKALNEFFNESMITYLKINEQWAKIYGELNKDRFC